MSGQFGQDPWGEELFGGAAATPTPPQVTTALTVRSLRRGRVEVTWPTLAPATDEVEYALQRSTKGPPQNILEGTRVLRFTAVSLRQMFGEENLSGGEYHYSLFARDDALSAWTLLYAGSGTAVGADHGWREGLYELMPAAVREADEGVGLQLKRYLSLHERELDLVRLKLDALTRARSPQAMPFRFLIEAAQMLGVRYEAGLGAATMRRVLERAPFFNARSGTQAGNEVFAEAITGWPVTCQHIHDDDDLLFYLHPGRINRLVNPSFETDTEGWVASHPLTRDDSIPMAASGSWSSVVTNDTLEPANVQIAAPDVGGFDVAIYGRSLYGEHFYGDQPEAGTAAALLPFAPAAANPLRAYTFSAYVLAVGALSVFAEITWYDADGIIVEVESSEPVAPAGGGVWQRLGVTSLAPDSAVTLSVSVRALQVPPGGTLYTDGCLLEEASTVQSYFDGDSVDPNDHSWDGVAHASESYQHLQRQLKTERLEQLLPRYLSVGQDLFLALTPPLSVPLPEVELQQTEDRNRLIWTYPPPAPDLTGVAEIRIYRQELVPTLAVADDHPGAVWRNRQLVAQGLVPEDLQWEDIQADPSIYDYRIMTLGTNGVVSVTDWVRSTFGATEIDSATWAAMQTAYPTWNDQEAPGNTWDQAEAT